MTWFQKSLRVDSSNSFNFRCLFASSCFCAKLLSLILSRVAFLGRFLPATLTFGWSRWPKLPHSLPLLLGDAWGWWANQSKMFVIPNHHQPSMIYVFIYVFYVCKIPWVWCFWCVYIYICISTCHPPLRPPNGHGTPLPPLVGVCCVEGGSNSICASICCICICYMCGCIYTCTCVCIPISTLSWTCIWCLQKFERACEEYIESTYTVYCV